jgi:hypothetical protein
MKKKEIWIIVIIAAAAAAAILIMNMVKAQNKAKTDEQASDGTVSGMPTEQAKGQWVAAIHGNEAELWFDSGVDDTYTLTGDYGQMTITVKDNKWCVSKVDCPNHNCEQMGWDDGTNMVPITCIPNNIIICTYDVALNYLGSNS